MLLGKWPAVTAMASGAADFGGSGWQEHPGPLWKSQDGSQVQSVALKSIQQPIQDIYIYNMICIYIHIFKQPFKHKMSFHPTATSRSCPPRLMSFPSQLPSVPVLLPCAGRQCWLWCCEEKEMKPHTMQRLLVEQTNSAPNWTAQFLLQLFEGWIFAWSSKFPTVEKSRWLLQSQSPCKVGACERAAQWAHASFLLSHFRWTLKVEKKRHRSARTTRKIHEAIDTWHYIYECSMFIHFTMIDRLNKYTFNYRLNQY